MENRNSMEQDNSSHIDISDQAEIQHWAEKLNVPEEILKDAVRAAGTTVVEVAEHLNENSPSRESASDAVRLKEGPWHDGAESSEEYRTD
ncbi:DUF3606 domain-containing protein [Flavobacterium sp. UW10123]|uniref:DUF3606 domain-containing protein n=1 Tax=Flavobacterium sp. UW10123 TaxID=3230800 RepID=UPI003397E9C4